MWKFLADSTMLSEDPRLNNLILEQTENVSDSIIDCRKGEIIRVVGRQVRSTTIWHITEHDVIIRDGEHRSRVALVISKPMFANLFQDYVIEVLMTIKRARGKLWRGTNDEYVSMEIAVSLFEYIKQLMEAIQGRFPEPEEVDGEEDEFDRAVAESLRSYSEEQNVKKETIDDSIKIKSVTVSDLPTFECPVCMEEVQCPTVAYKCETCKHRICEECFEECASRSCHCPCCLAEHPWNVIKEEVDM